MSQPLNITTATRFRGEGLVYVGSLVAQRGQVVIGMSDCDCPPCSRLDPWDYDRRVEVNLANGDKLVHARQSSFVRPDPPCQTYSMAGKRNRTPDLSGVVAVAEAAGVLA